MKHCRKMVLVDYDQEVEKVNKILNDKQTTESVPNINHKLSDEASSITLSVLDSDMNNILNQKNLSDIDKWKLYSKVLERYLFHIRNKQQSEENQEKQFNDILNNLKDLNSTISKTPIHLPKQNKKNIKKRNIFKQIARRRNPAKKIVQNIATPNSIISVYSDDSENFISDNEDENNSDVEEEENVTTRKKNKNKKSPKYEYRRNSKGRLKRDTLVKTAETIANNLENYNFQNWEAYNKTKNELTFD